MIICFSPQTHGILGNSEYEHYSQLFNETERNIQALEEALMLLDEQHEIYQNLHQGVTLHDVRRYHAQGLLFQFQYNVLQMFVLTMSYMDTTVGEHAALGLQNLKNVVRCLKQLSLGYISLTDQEFVVMHKQINLALSSLLQFGFVQFDIYSVLSERSKGLNVHSEIVFESNNHNEDRCLKTYEQWLSRIQQFVLQQQIANQM